VARAKVPEIVFAFEDPLPGVPEPEVVARAARGELLAQQSLMARHGAKLIRAIVKRKDYQTAEENALEAFRRSFKALRTRPIEDFWPFLLTTANRRSKTRWGKDKEYETSKGFADPNEIKAKASPSPTADATLEEAAATAEAEALRAETLATEPTISRLIFNERDLHDRSYDEIAEVTGLPRKELVKIVKAIYRRLGRKEGEENDENAEGEGSKET